MDGAVWVCSLLLLERKTFHLITLLAISIIECLVANKILYCIVYLICIVFLTKTHVGGSLKMFQSYGSF